MEIVLKKKTANNIDSAPYYSAEAFVKEVTFELGGQQIVKMPNTYFRIHDELFRKDSEKTAYKRMTHFDDDLPDGGVQRFYLPLLFFWCDNPGLALPLIAVQYHEAKIHVQFETDAVMARLGVDTAVDPECTLYVNYAFLDSEERRRYAQTSHEYLVTQVQTSGSESIAPSTSTRKTTNVRLNLNHPCKFLAWVMKKPGVHGKFTTSSALDETNDSYAPLYEAKLTLNGHDRFSTRKGSYFNQVVPYEAIQSSPAAGVYIYSFALKPADHQPSGTCNFSRVDNATLILTLKAGSDNVIGNVTSEETTLDSITDLTSLEIFASSYNVLRIMSGMGGLAYSN